MTQFILPAGVYWIGDPCYIMSDDKWQVWLDEVKEADNTMSGEVDGLLCIGLHTEWGDGTYNDQYGNEYGVDAGMIGIIPAEGVAITDMDSGHFFDFKTDFVVKREDKGLLVFGHVQIVTDGSDQSDEDEEESW